MKWPFQKTLNKEAAAGPVAIDVTQLMAAVNTWRETLNPLRGLTMAQAVSYLEASQRGDFADLQWLYFFIEQNDATLFALLDRRISALLSLDWNVKIVDEDEYGESFNQKLADDQRDFLRESYDRIDNLYEAIEHLELASFRSFAHVQKHRNSDGMVKHLEPLDQWNWAREGMYGAWYWNPDATHSLSGNLPAENKLGGEKLPESDFIVRVCRRHINRIAMVKYIRKAMGEKDWAAFVEVYGIPGWVITMPPNIPDAKVSEYYAAALKVAAGGSGAIPNGSTAQASDSPRGVNPFKEFIRQQDEEMVKAGTGGILTMLAESGSGTLAGNAHMEAFKLIAAMEAAKISEVLQKQFDKVELERQFPGQPVLAYFELAANEKRAPGEILDDLVKARNAGMQGNPEEVSEKTGYTLTLAPANPAPVQPIIAQNKSDEEVLPEAPAQELLAIARVQLPAAQHKVLEALARPFVQIYEMARAGKMTPAEISAALIKLRDEQLPEILVQMSAAPDTEKVLFETISAAIGNGIEERAAQTGDAK